MSVTLSELKSHLRITSDTEDTLLSIYLDAAHSYLDSYTGRKLKRGAEQSHFDGFSDLELIGDNVDSVTVTYIDLDGVEQTLSSSVYLLKQHKTRPYLTLAYNQTWPSIRSEDAAVRVDYTSGYDASTLPDTLKAAILIEAATQYEFRENESIVKTQQRKTVERLSNPFRVINL